MKTLILALLAAVATLGGDFNPYFLSDGLPSAYLCLGKSGEPILLRIPKSFLTEAEKDTNITLAVAKIYSQLVTNWVTVKEDNCTTPAEFSVLCYDTLYQVGNVITNQVCAINGQVVFLKELGRDTWPSQQRAKHVIARFRRFSGEVEYLDEKGAK
jgi:hypothetical protein